MTVYQEPVLNVNTASYQDIDTSTQFISDRKLAGSEMILIVGDQQLHIRLLWQKIYNPDRWNWMLPLPGEWHFSVHVLMALHKLWFRPLVEKLIIGLSFSKAASLSNRLARSDAVEVHGPGLRQPQGGMQPVRRRKSATGGARAGYNERANASQVVTLSR